MIGDHDVASRIGVERRGNDHGILLKAFRQGDKSIGLRPHRIGDHRHEENRHQGVEGHGASGDQNRPQELAVPVTV